MLPAQTKKKDVERLKSTDYARPKKALSTSKMEKEEKASITITMSGQRQSAPVISQISPGTPTPSTSMEGMATPRIENARSRSHSSASEIARDADLALPITDVTKKVRGVLYEVKALSDTVKLVSMLMPNHQGYAPGSLVRVWVHQDPAQIKRVLVHLGIKENAIVDTRRYDKLNPFLGEVTIASCAFASILNVNGRVTRNFLQCLREYVKGWDAKKIDAMIEIMDEKKVSVVAEAGTVASLLCSLPSLAITVDELMEICPKLYPRYYSVASSTEDDPRVVSFVAKKIEGKGGFVGTASGFFERVRVGDQIPFQFATLSLQCPSPAQLVVMVCTASAIGPFRAFLRYTLHKMKLGVIMKPDNWHLFYGCREKKDALFSDELLYMDQVGVLKSLNLCYSGESVNERPPEHVQDRLRAECKLLSSVVRANNSLLMIAGPKRLAVEVRAVIVRHLLVQQERMKPEDASELYDSLIEMGRIRVEAWD
mmetsp:Transcript_15752/g.29922  ORF Transcript_15752/g.29922 Transcript_15752/m.29922 type:complete len:483 (-) Transcript_15752:251-1699(-)